MGFGNGALLAGMALALIPIIIHLINRRRATLRRFAAIDFLLMSDKRVARRLKLRQFLVLALRVLLLAALAFALAKPYMEPDELGAVDTSDPAGVVLLIDDSLSMDAKNEDGTTRYDRAIEAAERLVDGGGARTSFAVIAMGTPARLLTKGLTYDKAAVGRALRRIERAPRGADFAGAFVEAGRVLSDASESRRLIYVVGDQAAHAWSALPYRWDFVPATQVEPIDITRDTPLANLAVTGVEVTASDKGGDRQRGNTLDVQISVVNHGPLPQTVPVEVTIGDKTVADSVTIAPGVREEVALTLVAPPGVTRGEAHVVSDDALESDDRWYFSVDQRPTVTALVVNGAPQSVAYLDEVFFLRAALSARASADIAVNPLYISADDLTPARVTPVDLVILANVGALEREQQLALRNFVVGGGGLLVTAGDNFGDGTNAAYGDLLPYPIRGVKTVAKAGAANTELAALTWATADFEHPVMQVFAGLEDASLFKARVYAYALVDTTGRQDAKVVASYADGIPALVESRVGEGRVMMLTSSADRDWTDLAFRSSYPALIQRIAQYLARALGEDATHGHLVGQPVRVPTPDGRGPLTLVRPDGVEVPLSDSDGGGQEGDAAEAATVYLEGPMLVGHYSVRRGTDPRHSVSFAVNSDRRESDFSRVDTSVVASVTTEVTRDNGVIPDYASAQGQDDAPQLDASLGGSGGRTILWPYILAGLFLLFGAEAWLLVRG
ncbi:MAG: hypothetical protein ACI9MR_004975 [Myxococcota bacterium]|jgi:hypothetical protein